MKKGFELKVIIPIRTKSELNACEHWGKRYRRRKAQREMIFYELASRSTRKPKAPIDIWLTRIAPRMLDIDDNLNASFKAIRDGIADWIGIDDKSNLLRWRYSQKKGGVGEYAIIVEIYADEYV